MQNNSIIKQWNILILSVVLIFGCKENADQSSVESVATTSVTSNPLNLINNETYGQMTHFTTVFNTDYLSVGTGGLRDDGIGQINVIGTFPLSSVTKAYLYWHGDSPTEQVVQNTMKLNGLTVNGTNIGITRPNDGPGNLPYIDLKVQAFRADVTAIVKSASSRVFAVSDFGQQIANGASLILFYSDGNSNNNRDIVLFNGNDSNFFISDRTRGYENPFDHTGWDVFLSGVKYTSGIVNVTMHVADGEHFIDGFLYLNNVELGRSIFKGNSVPGSSTTRAGRWDIIPKEVSGILTPGLNTMHLTMPDYYDDLLSLVVVVFNLPKGAAPTKILRIPFDYAPRLCSNITYFPGLEEEAAAILGTSTFNVNQIDRSSIKINGIPIERSFIEDMSAPNKGPVLNCSTCSTLPPDGIKDLKIIINLSKLRPTISPLFYGPYCYKLILTGKLLPLYGSTPIESVDYLQASLK